jgi:Golgi phosphoprotein 3 (GPP34)
VVSPSRRLWYLPGSGRIVAGVDTLGEDLVLLSLSPHSGRVTTAEKIGYDLVGSELVRLVAMGRVGIQSGRVSVLNAEPAGDAQLDAALADIARARRPPKAEHWVGRPRRGICAAYLELLAAAGCVQKRGGLLTRWRVANAPRLAEARARLDAVATSAGRIDLGQAAFGGLAHAIGLDTVLYPGWGNRAIRKRFQEVAKGQWTKPFTLDRAAGPERVDIGDAVGQASRAAHHSATHAAAHAATHAATAAATHAATHAAVHAATHAAVHAAVHASVSAGHSAAVGGHGGQ